MTMKDVDNPPEITCGTKEYVEHIEKIQDLPDEIICSCIC